MKNKHVGSTLESLFEETGEIEEVRARAEKKLIADELRRAMEKAHITPSEMAKRMHTSRAAVYRLLDPWERGMTLDSLWRASAVLGMRARIHFERDPSLRRGPRRHVAKRAAS